MTQPRLFGPGRLRILLFCAALFATAQFHRAAGGVLATTVGPELGLGAAVLGVALGAMFIASMTMQIPAGILFDRYGARRITPILLISTGLGALWFSQATTFPDLILSRLILGASSGVTGAASFVLFARWFPKDRFSTVMGLMVAIGGVGGLSGTYPLALLSEIFGWRTVMGYTGVLSFGLAAFCIAAIKDKPADYGADDRPASLKDTLAGYREIFAMPRFYPILIMGTVTFAPITTIIGLWGGPYLADVHGLDTTSAGLVLFAMFAITIGGALAFGPLDRVLGGYRPVVIGGAVISSAALGLLALFPAMPLAGAVACLVVMVLAQHYYITLSAQNRALFPAHLVGRASTLLLVFQVGGISAMQAGFGAALTLAAGQNSIAPADYGYGFAFMAFGVFAAMLVYAICMKPTAQI